MNLYTDIATRNLMVAHATAAGVITQPLAVPIAIYNGVGSIHTTVKMDAGAAAADIVVLKFQECDDAVGTNAADLFQIEVAGNGAPIVWQNQIKFQNSDFTKTHLRVVGTITDANNSGVYDVSVVLVAGNSAFNPLNSNVNCGYAFGYATSSEGSLDYTAIIGDNVTAL